MSGKGFNLTISLQDKQLNVAMPMVAWGLTMFVTNQIKHLSFSRQAIQFNIDTQEHSTSCKENHFYWKK